MAAAERSCKQATEVWGGVAASEDLVAQRRGGGSFERVVGVADVGGVACGFLQIANTRHFAVTRSYPAVLAALDRTDGVAAVVAIAHSLVADPGTLIAFDKLWTSPLNVSVAS